MFLESFHDAREDSEGLSFATIATTAKFSPLKRVSRHFNIHLLVVDQLCIAKHKVQIKSATYQQKVN
jgi:hypothetical protein